MKKFIYFFSIVLLFSCGQSKEQNKETESVSPNKNYIAVYDFHTDHRCESCLTIEKLTKETLNESFKNELNDSTIVFSLINVDVAENDKIAEEYQAFGTALMITVFKDGEEDILDLTEWAFEAIHGNDFKKELKKELNNGLKKL